MSAPDQLPGHEPDRVALGRAMADDVMDAIKAKPDRARRGAAFGGCLLGAVVFWVAAAIWALSLLLAWVLP